MDEYEARRREREAQQRAAYDAVTDPRMLALLDVLAPRRNGERTPTFEWGHEATPTAEDMIELACELLAALDQVDEAH